MTHILSSCQPRVVCTQTPCQHLAMKLVTELFADPNIAETQFQIQNHEFILVCTRQGLILYSRWVAVATAQVLAFTVGGRHFK